MHYYVIGVIYLLDVFATFPNVIGNEQGSQNRRNLAKNCLKSLKIQPPPQMKIEIFNHLTIRSGLIIKFYVANP